MIQVINKVGGTFTEHDERRLRAFSAQASIAIENAQLFEEVVRVKNYNESILRSMSNGVITLDAQGCRSRPIGRLSLVLVVDSPKEAGKAKDW